MRIFERAATQYPGFLEVPFSHLLNDLRYMEVIWNKNRMQVLLHNFHLLTKAYTCFFMPDGRELQTYPGEHFDFCKLIRNGVGGDRKCRDCDREALHYVMRHRKIHIYRCHAGLTEAVAPIIDSIGNETVAYLMFGQIRRHDDPAAQEMDSELSEAYASLPILTTDQVMAAAHILQALADYVRLEDYVRVQHEHLGVRTVKYIRENLTDDLSIKALSQKMGVGKTSLCLAVRREFGLSVGEMVKDIRIRKAESLLRTTALPIYTIAGAVGIEDYNYFSKVFKASRGVSPSHYRKGMGDSVDPDYSS
jgi:AraC-like DNA-binding protein